MFAVPSTREMRPVGVLLGGSGLARMSASQAPQVAELLKPTASASVRACWAAENRVFDVLIDVVLRSLPVEIDAE